MPPLADDGMSGTNPRRNIRHSRHRHRHPPPSPRHPCVTCHRRILSPADHTRTAFPSNSDSDNGQECIHPIPHIIYTTHSSTTLHTHYIHHHHTSCQTPFQRVTTMVSVPCSNPGYHSHPPPPLHIWLTHFNGIQPYRYQRGDQESVEARWVR